MSTKPQKFIDITPDMIAAWKAEGHINMTEISIFLDDDDLSEKSPQAKFVICQPTRAVVNAGAKYSNDGKFDRANKLFISSCVLGGDMEHLNPDNADNRVELKVLEEIGKLIEIKKATVKKL